MTFAYRNIQHPTYQYRLKEDYIHYLKNGYVHRIIDIPVFYYGPYIEFHAGILTIRSGYAWKGESTRSCLLQDALTQLCSLVPDLFTQYDTSIAREVRQTSLEEGRNPFKAWWEWLRT